jgi:monoamine oxidase
MKTPYYHQVRGLESARTGGAAKTSFASCAAGSDSMNHRSGAYYRIIIETTLIIGAGLAGLSAGSYLKAQGAKSILLEARQRIGGRVWTDRCLDGMALESGASWIHGLDINPLALMARDCEIQIVPTNYYSAPLTYRADGVRVAAAQREADHLRLKRLLDRLGNWREKLDRDMPLGLALKRAVAQLRLSLQQQRGFWHAVHTEIEQDYATEVQNLSLWYWDEVEEYGGKHLLVPGGYDQLIQQLAGDLEIRLGHVVRSIEYGSRKVRVTTDCGIFTGDRAIVTLPLGVLQAGAVTFSPALPTRKILAINNLRMGVLNKLHLLFPRQFWPPKPDWIEYIAPRRGVWAEFFNHARYANAPILTAFNVGSHAQALERLSDEATVATCMKVLRIMFGSTTPDPVSFLVTRWASDPFAMGAYCHIPPGGSGEDLDTLAEPVGDRLFFAGEAALRAHYGTTHGALESGVRAALSVQNRQRRSSTI